ncbi:sensor histidine kinase [Leucobacter chinensis]|uniref:sensor histidine kinase n=1 Tax=Leucobacter chinensis TaxID=2851010 RepID=UPI001C22783C
MTQDRYDEDGYRRSVATIGWQVMAVCAALVVIGGAVILAFVFWQTTPWEANKPPRADEIEVRLDPGELLLAVVLLATGAILSAGFAARIIARRAVKPLDEAFQMQRRFVADASHELRTPLAVLNARTQQLAALMTDDGPHGEIIADLRQDARIMSEVVNDMLEAATGAPVPEGSASLTEVFTALARDIGPAAEAAGIALRVEALAADIAQAAVPMPERALRRCLVALVDNALDHAPAGSVIAVEAQRVAPARPANIPFMRITIADQGSGIRGIDAKRVFDRFASGEAPESPRRAARTNRGIGLALAKELCERYGGSIAVAQTDASGTTFEVLLPELVHDGTPHDEPVDHP